MNWSSSCKGHRIDQFRAKVRSGLFHSWYTDPRLQSKGDWKSSVIHKSAITDHAMEENNVINWDKAKWSIERHSDKPDL